MSGSLLCAEKMPRAAARVGLLALCCLLLASCGFRQSRLRAEEAVKEFHALLDKGQYETIYDRSDDSLKQSMSKADFVSYVRDIHQRLGFVRRSATRGFQINSVAGQGTRVSLSNETEFDRGTAAERFVWRINGNQVVLSEYAATVEKTAAPPSV